ncbi:MAG TPA: hypothetical protein PK728_10360, partial [Bacillota bacterium]|nr:hypothetical protein [Bacillota bacterium]
MIKSGKTVVFPVLFLFIFTLLAGLAGRPREVWAAGQSQAAAGAGAAATGESLDELRAELWKTTDVLEKRNIVDNFKSMPGPDAAAARVLLDYLKENPGIDIDPGNVIDALVKLMTDEQVSQLTKDINTYIDTTYNGANYYPLLVPVLAARINNPNDLTNAVLSLQESCYFEAYRQLLPEARQKIFTEPAGMVQWLDEVYAKLTKPMARESLVHAVVTVVQKQPAGASRSAVTGWLWRVQEKEPDPVNRCHQLFTLYELGEARALRAIEDLYSGLPSTGAKVDLIHRIGSFTRSQLKDTDKDGLIEWLWKTAEKDASPYCRQECLAVLYTNLGQEKALEQFVRDTDQNGVAAFAGEDNIFRIDGPDWQLLRDAGQKYPQSYLGRGIKAYEEVRGWPYFEIDRPEESFEVIWVPPYGDEQYDPDREIPGWEKFLAEFPRHPASDDAAYRLARCYEIKGRYADAVKTMQKARYLPDGDMRYAAD